LKKFPSLKVELIELSDALLLNPRQGVKLTETIYKIRLASKSKGKGKSGGFRVITYIVENAGQDDEYIVVTLLSIYDKSEINTLKNSEISLLVEDFLKSNENDI
jgi:mRNA-degrading endonuclease RelE of RelBE toxin-antitoxin system